MSADMNTNQRPEQHRFDPPPTTDISDDNFEPYETYGKTGKTGKLASKHTGRKVAIIVLVIILLAAAGVAAYMLFLKPKPVAKSTSNSSQSSTAASTSATNPTVAAPTKHDDSTNFNLGLDYPTTWTLADADGIKLTVRSSIESLPSTTGTTQKGQILLTIQNKQTSLSDFAKGSAVAVLDSDKVAYTKPTSNQRANTYLSYLQYAATTSSGALDGIYITGDNGYQKGQNVPQADVIGVDPLVTVTFLSCSDTACATTKPFSIEASNWQKNTLSLTVKTMLQSLSFN